ncbi:C-GCAxxG-C-C family (seleno)protein [Gemmatimonadota bacterium]
MINVLDHAFKHPLKLEEHASMPFNGGINRQGYQCGLVWGAALAAGAQAYQVHGSSPQAETAAIIATQRLVDSFRDRFENINCLEITECEMQSMLQIFKFLIKSGAGVGCIRMASKFAPVAYSEIDTALSDESIEAPVPPVSCAALLARKMGASELHAVMAAGFAGGIGLCGGACGALGTAIWIHGMKSLEEGTSNKELLSDVNDMMDRFAAMADYEFECSEIVGRKFEAIEDHAGYLRDGGCSELIDALAAQGTAG